MVHTGTLGRSLTLQQCWRECSSLSFDTQSQLGSFLQRNSKNYTKPKNSDYSTSTASCEKGARGYIGRNFKEKPDVVLFCEALKVNFRHFGGLGECCLLMDAVLHLVQRALIYLGVDATTEPRRAIFQQCTRCHGEESSGRGQQCGHCQCHQPCSHREGSPGNIPQDVTEMATAVLARLMVSVVPARIHYRA